MGYSFNKIKKNCAVLNAILSLKDTENSIKDRHLHMVAYLYTCCGGIIEDVPSMFDLIIGEERTIKIVEHCKEWLLKSGSYEKTCYEFNANFRDSVCKDCIYNGIISSPLQLGEIVDNIIKVPAFPTDSLPNIFREYTNKAANAIKCPADFIATALLTCSGTLIGAARQIKVSPTWILYPNIYTCLVGSPSSKKSPAISQIVKYINEIETNLQDQYGSKLSEYETLLQQNKGNKTNMPVKPTLERIITNNATVESIVELLSQNNRGILLYSDELKAWINSMGEYKSSNNADKQFYLTAWNGDRYVQDRKGKDPIIANTTLVSVIGGIQPTVIKNMENIGDGFFERIIFSYPDAGNCFGSTDYEIGSNLENQIRSCLNDLHKLLYTGSIIIELENEARESFKTWERRLEDCVNFKYFNPIHEALYCKISGTTAKIALIIHMVKCVTGDYTEKVTQETMESAITITDYFLQHSKQVIGLIQKEITSKLTDTVYSWICKKGYIYLIPSTVSKYKVAGIKTSEEAKEVLNNLIKGKKMLYDSNNGRYLVLYEP